MPKINLKKVFAMYREEFCSIKLLSVGRLFDDVMRQECAMLAQTETKSKEPFATVMVDRIDPMV